MSDTGDSKAGDARTGNRSQLVCLLVCLALSFFIVFMLGGALVPGFAATLPGQAVLAAIAAPSGWAVGLLVHKRFFAPR